MRDDEMLKKWVAIALCCCIGVAVTGCARREAPGVSEPVPSQSESAPSNDSPSESFDETDSQSEAEQDESQSAETAVFAVGANLEDEKNMHIGDTIGEWTLADLKISYHDEEINMLEAMFEGNVTLKGTISRNPLVEYGFGFEVSKEDSARIPYYIAPEMTRKDNFWFMLDFEDNIDEAVKLEHGEEMECEITISEYRFIFAYMMAPSGATVVDIKLT